ncbi:MAG: CRISPR-associated helicase Cas3' [Oscillochloridaceae bacterium]|nr:CRISPR-associated helicase Cas3' [Chloroflexaceae bacterium]MDW8389519.1 CRISPR-associated helicase Cas3' [Oscillochloridaceae bacterium]
MADLDLLQFWGKTPRPELPVERFHPAIFHMLDVACVAEALARDGPPRAREALAHAWRGANIEALLKWLPFLVAIHDLGKISAVFQGQDEAQRHRLERAGVRFDNRQVELYHAQVSALWLHDRLTAIEPGIAHELLWIIRDAMGGHHGRFAEAAMSDIRKRLHHAERAEPRWKDWRNEAYRLLRNLLAPRDVPLAAIGAPAALRPATVALTGLIVWCDWIGSNERDFPLTPAMRVEDYLNLSRQRARDALTTHHLTHRRAAPGYAGFQKLFPATAPRPLQALIDILADDALAEPLLAVIEAPTGEGKTEAALALARRIAARRGIDEIFFALPTMATGNQMFSRLETFYRNLYGADGGVRLIHGQAIVVEEDLRRQVALHADADRYDAGGRSADALLEWFVGPKRAMLAPFGVGTVDQVELAGLNVRHYPLRLFGLAGKVVIIDEVHAYDAYMSVIIEHTLTWLATLGCSVILLSATLPRARHRALARAFLSGLGGGQATDPAQDAPYPVLAIYRRAASEQREFNVFRPEQRFTLRVRRLGTPEEEAHRLVELVRGGGAVARICNRVDDAQAIYRALGALDAAGARVLLHARFPLHERQGRERRIGDLLGKTSQRAPDQPIIVVGTQVLEQSLDYDVDVMISDFAPIDLLLQRAGRLHRHSRSRPERHREPALEVALPHDEQGNPDWRRWRAIYEPYILWRTLAALRDGMAGDERLVTLPRDYRTLIEAVYGDAPLSGPYAGAIAAAEQAYRKTINLQTARARNPLAPDAMSRAPIVEDGGRAFIEDETGEAASWQLAKTRLGDQVTLVPVYAIDGELSLDAGGTFRVPTDAPPTLEQMKDLIAYAVPVSDRAVIAAYRDERRVRALRWPWSAIPAPLRGLHPLPLDPRTHSATLNGRRLRLDNELGLVIEQADAATEDGWFEEDV